MKKQKNNTDPFLKFSPNDILQVHPSMRAAQDRAWGLKQREGIRRGSTHACIHLCHKMLVSVTGQLWKHTHSYVPDEGDISPAGWQQVSAGWVQENSSIYMKQMWSHLSFYCFMTYINLNIKLAQQSFKHTFLMRSGFSSRAKLLFSFASVCIHSPPSHLDRQYTASARDRIMNCSLQSLFASLWKQSGASHWANKTAASLAAAVCRWDSRGRFDEAVWQTEEGTVHQKV